MKKKIKCGGYTLQDGIITKHPTRTFKKPAEMPGYLKEDYPHDDGEALVFFGMTLGQYEKVCDQIDESNALKESRWKAQFQRRYKNLEMAYFLGELSKKMPRFIGRYLTKRQNKLIQSVMHEYARPC